MQARTRKLSRKNWQKPGRLEKKSISEKDLTSKLRLKKVFILKLLNRFISILIEKSIIKKNIM